MNTMLYRTSCLLTLCALTGCSLAPDYERPAAPIAAHYSTQDTSATASTAVLEDGSLFYTDERLRKLITLALANNRDLRLAALTSERLQSQYRIRLAEQWPALNAEISQEHIRPESSSDTATYGLAISGYELDLFGRVHNLKEAALADYFSSVASRHAAQLSLTAAVATTDLSLRADERLLALARESLQDQQQTTALTHKRAAEGLDDERAYQQSLSAEQDAIAAVARYEQQRALDEHALLQLLGVPELPTDIPSAAIAPVEQVIGDVPAGLPADLLTRRPDIVAAEDRLMAANASIGAARAAFFPRITLTGSYGRASNDLAHLFNDSVRGWSFSPSVTLPLFDFGAHQANLEVAKIEKDMAVAEYEKAIQGAFREVADSLSAKATLRQDFEAAQRKAEAQHRSAQLADQRFQVGRDSRIDMMSARTAWRDARQAQIQVSLRQQLNLITLYKSLGGGWDRQALLSHMRPAT
ncbi:efflux transporter outer membrane subunit [Zymobacter palmae]|uniref:Outer membrane protein n=1 Tax=Zymobacter palmae TaxID=33074 RepID=A0A348HCM6_9GAMM|nr:efflux transporter outer membrane subunit [Zymobacter palmae]BBG29378.1 outer membrane protein [Zymobacter palmae]